MMKLILPRLGIINVPLAVAPFQIPFSVSGYDTPQFINGSSYFQGGGFTAFGGFWGLNYIYTNGQMTTQPSDINDAETYFDVGNLREIAGGVVQSFGIYDYISSISNTFQKPYQGGSAQRYDRMFLSQGPNSLYAYTAIQGNSSYPNSINVAKSFLPNIAFSNYHGPLTGSTIKYTWSTTQGTTGNLFPSAAPVFFNPSSGQATFPPPGTVQNVGSDPHVANPFVFASTYNANIFCESYIPAPTQYPTLGLFCPSAQANDGSNFLAKCSFSPKYSVYLTRYNSSANLGMGYLSLFTNDTQFFSDTNDIRANHFQPIQLADPNDDADLNTESSTSNAGAFTCTPSGDFLCQPPNNQSFNSYLISGNGLGYYKLIFTGVTFQPGSFFNSGGFGIDTNGHFWAFNGNTLYSNLGLGASLSFNLFPNVSLGAVGCRRNQCAWPWYG